MSAGQPNDGELLARFVQKRDEMAFELTVRRHATLVLNACRRVLGHTHDAEDAAQAVFLTLARKAGRLTSAASIAPWLVRVAHQVAIDANRADAARRKHEQGASGASGAPGAPAMQRPDDSAQQAELRSALARELDALPEKYRNAVVLHHLAGHSEAETAQILGCAEGTACTWLARGRELLRDRLARRGAMLSLVGICGLLSAEAGAAELPVTFVPATLEAARVALAGKLAATGTALSPQVVALSEGVLRTMFWSRVKVACASIVCASLLGSLLGMTAYRAWAEDSAPPKKEEKKEAAVQKKTEDQVDAKRAEKATVVIRGILDEEPANLKMNPFVALRVLKVLKQAQGTKIGDTISVLWAKGFPVKTECVVYLTPAKRDWMLLGASVATGIDTGTPAAGRPDPAGPNVPNNGRANVAPGVDPTNGANGRNAP